MLFCRRCDHNVCEACAGTPHRPLAPICICRRCESREAWGRLAPSESAQRRIQGLISGRALIREDTRREDTVKTYASSIKHLQRLLDTIEVELPDVDITHLELMVVDMLAGGGLDTPTCDNAVKAVWELFEFLRHEVALEDLANPCESKRLHKFMKVVRWRFKKLSKSRLALTMGEAKRMFAYGFGTDRDRQGHHARLYYMFLTWGCLRKKACAQLKVEYTITGDGQVAFGVNSDVKIFNDPTYGDIIEVRVVGDKNLRSGERHTAFLVDNKYLGVTPAKDLTAYLLMLRPPSGGTLFRQPKQKSGWSKSLVFANPNPALRAAFTRIHGGATKVDKGRLARVGTHSGRKSLGQWLYDDENSIRFIQDLGGWTPEKNRSAVHLYMTTAWDWVVKVLFNLKPPAWRRGE